MPDFIRLKNTTQHILHLQPRTDMAIAVPPTGAGPGLVLLFEPDDETSATEERARFETMVSTQAVQALIASGELVVVRTAEAYVPDPTVPAVAPLRVTRMAGVQ